MNKEILKQWVDLMAMVVAGFMIACILGYMVMFWDAIDVGTLSMMISGVILLGCFIFLIFPTKEKGEST